MPKHPWYQLYLPLIATLIMSAVATVTVMNWWPQLVSIVAVTFMIALTLAISYRSTERRKENNEKQPRLPR